MAKNERLEKINENTNNSTTKKEINNHLSKKSKRFWKYFWGTIIFIGVIFIGLNITASKKLNEMSAVDREAKLESIVKDFKHKFPEFIEMTEFLNKQSIKKIKLTINKEINNAYRPLYGQIDNFSDFHYSVTGEYTELFTIIFGKIENILNDKVFNPAQFNLKLDDALININNESLIIVKEQLEQMKNKIQTDMNLNNDEVDFLFINILKITQKDMKNRFLNSSNNLFKVMGLGVGTGVGSIMAKVISKKVATKITTKVAIKSGAKLAGAGAGVLTGSTSGLLCGPATWLCSPVGAIAGGIVGWFTTDKIVVEIDQHYNELEFRNDIKILIDNQKETTKNTLYSIYTKSFDKLSENNKNMIENLKSKTIKDIIGN